MNGGYSIIWFLELVKTFQRSVVGEKRRKTSKCHFTKQYKRLLSWNLTVQLCMCFYLYNDFWNFNVILTLILKWGISQENSISNPRDRKLKWFVCGYVHEGREKVHICEYNNICHLPRIQGCSAWPNSFESFLTKSNSPERKALDHFMKYWWL